MTTQVAIRTNIRLKEKVMKRAKAHGLSMTFVINGLMERYAAGDFAFGFIPIDRSKEEPEVEDLTEELMMDEEIAKAANALAEYVRNNPPV